VQFSWGLPANATISAIRRAGAKLGIQVTSAEGARAALDAGADYLVCQGTEAGGHVQASRGLYETLPIVLQEAKGKPVIASGGIGNGAGIRKALLAGASATMLGTRFVATTESYAHQDYKQALVAAHARDTALTICFQDGWPALHRVLRNRTFVMWERAGCPSPGKRPGEGELVATRSNGEKELRYSTLPPDRDFTGLLGRWRCMLAWALTMLRICPRPESWFSVFGENAKPRNSVTYEQSNKVLAYKIPAMVPPGLCQVGFSCDGSVI
jgi:nitronate monooxygenase